MVVIAVPWASVPEAVASLAWDGNIVVDQTPGSSRSISVISRPEGACSRRGARSLASTW
jgi:predicted dinucleotide-binding enzyme